MDRTKKDLLSGRRVRRDGGDKSQFCSTCMKPLTSWYRILALYAWRVLLFVCFDDLIRSWFIKLLLKNKRDVNWPVATERTSTLLSLMMGLKMCLVSAVPARFLLWHFKIRRSSCFCSRTRMSSRRSVYNSESKQRGSSSYFTCQTWAEVYWSFWKPYQSLITIRVL